MKIRILELDVDIDDDTAERMEMVGLRVGDIVEAQPHPHHEGVVEAQYDGMTFYFNEGEWEEVTE
jgi:hypothetical protein